MELQQLAKPKTQHTLSNLMIRAMSSLVLVFLLLLFILWGGWVFTIPLMIVSALSFAELYMMRARSERGGGDDMPWAIINGLSLIALGPLGMWQIAMAVFVLSVLIITIQSLAKQYAMTQIFSRLRFFVFSILYVAVPYMLIAFVRKTDVSAFPIHWTFLIFFSAMANDTFAYFGGKSFGKTPLVPTLSPNKTWEGAIIGVLVGTLVPSLLLIRIQQLIWLDVLVLFVAAVACVLGDLFESGLKRHHQVKDSHLPHFNLFPGHGGILDRIDGLLWVIYTISVYLIFFRPV